MMFAERSDTTVPLTLVIEQEGVGGVTGQVPTVALRDALTTNSYFDWSDSIFKTSGWVTKFALMSEVERGHYLRTFDPTLATSLLNGSVLVVEFQVNDGANVVGSDADLLMLVASLQDIPATINVPSAAVIADAVWDESSAAHVTSGSMGERQARLDALISSRATSGQGLTVPQATMLLEMYELLGLDPTKPLIVTATTRRVPSDGSIVNQTITDVAGTVTVQRQP